MHPILEKVFETGQFTTSAGQTVAVDSETPRGQCQFLQDIIRDNKFKASVEVGLAYGTSTLAIAEAIAQNGGKHLAIDPYENTYWKGCGLDLVKQAGQQVEFYDDFSYRVLPRLLDAGRRFDFAYIDSTKLTDWLMTDFFLLDKLLEINGVIVFDDVTYPSIRKLVRYLAQLPHYQVYGQWPQNKKLSAVRKIIKSSFLLQDGLRIKDYRLGIYTRCVALIKKGEDVRKYDWHTKF